jgi:hypothetical protein
MIKVESDVADLNEDSPDMKTDEAYIPSAFSLKNVEHGVSLVLNWFLCVHVCIHLCACVFTVQSIYDIHFRICFSSFICINRIFLLVKWL